MEAFDHFVGLALNGKQDFFVFPTFDVLIVAKNKHKK